MVGFDCFDRQCIEHGEDLRREAFADLQNMAERLSRQDTWLAQRQVAQDGPDQILKLFVRRPAQQREGFEPARELRVAVDGLACFSYAEATRATSSSRCSRTSAYSEPRAGRGVSRTGCCGPRRSRAP